MQARFARIRWLAVPFLFVLGCSGSTGVSTGTPGPETVSVTGIILRIEDFVPVDGGVSLELKRDDGGMETAYLPSFFTDPPPPPEHQEIYQVILGLEVGDRITVEGERTDSGIQIEKLIVLDRGP